MLKQLIIVVMTGVASVSMAADADNGKVLYEAVQLERIIGGVAHSDANCETCHDTAYFQRKDRAATSYAKLKGWIEGCNTNLDVGWFPDEFEDVTAYMNRAFYRFPSPE